MPKGVIADSWFALEEGWLWKTASAVSAKTLAIGAAAFGMLALTSCACQTRSTPSGRSPDTFAKSSLKGARIVYIAEKHDEPSHHQFQERVIRALHQSGKPVTVGMEMIDVTQQAVLDEYLHGAISWNDFARRSAFNRGWGKTSPAYERILIWCRRHEVPVVGLNAPETITRKLARGQRLTAAEKQSVPNFPEPPGGFKQFQKAMTSHATSGSLRRYYEAQRAWDMTMAARILRWLPQHPGTMVVLLGRFHADPRTGVPWYVARNSNAAQVILYPQKAGTTQSDRRD
jgi:uncharacterized iron-regulated protein